MITQPLLTPENEHSPNPAEESSSASAPGSQDERINILLVDDEPKNLTALETVLAGTGYRLVCAGSADEALLALVAEEFALLVLDVQMPGMNGFELAQMIRQRKKTASVPIIFLTAYYGEDQHVLEGYSSGAVDYLHKPINAAVLRSKVAIFAELHRTTRESESANLALLAEVAERRHAQEQLRKLNEELERRVTARTAALAESEARLREADKRKDEFLAMLGHELRNPLAAIRHAVRIDCESISDPAAQHWASEVIDRQSAQLTRLVDDLLDVERINRGRIELRSEPLELGVVLARAVEAVRSLVEEKKHTLSVETESGLHVRGDSARLQQVFVNLLANAAKYTGEAGRIRVAARREQTEAVISVSDNGIGLSAELLPRVFELFTQVHTSLDRANGGLGIGLTVAKSLIEMHGGRIAGHSEGAGRGCTFTVHLPVLDPAENGAAMAANWDASGARGIANSSDPSAIRILVVDDHRDAGDALSRLLVRRGFDVRIARDGMEGLALAHQVRPSVFLLDIGLPGVDGYELCRTLRADPAFAGARFIATSGYAQSSDVELSLAAGFDLHLAKPLDFSAVLTAIRGPDHPER